MVAQLSLAAGGLALFVFGMNTVSAGLREAFGGALKFALALVTRHRLLAALTGMGITVLMASSSATTALLVGLADAGVIALGQSLAVILGADIGTALTLQIIAFDIGAYAGVLVAAGLFGSLFTRYTRARSLWRALMGLGVIFLGLELMSQGVKPLVNTPGAREWLFGLLANPLAGCAAATIFTGVIQSSAATLVLGFTFMDQGLSLEQAVPLLLGANLGTCATALLVSIGSSRRGWRIALAHTLFKFVGVVVVLPLAGPFASMVGWLSGAVGADQPARLLTNGHLTFNVLLLVGFLPVLGLVNRVVCALAPIRGPAVEGILDHVRPEDVAHPEAALAALRGDVAQLGRRVRTLLLECHRAIETGDQNLLDDVVTGDDRVDLAEGLVTDYLLKLADDQLSADGRAFKRKLFHTVRDLEAIGDVVSKELVALGRKHHMTGTPFSVQDWDDLMRLQRRVVESFDCAIALFEDGDVSDAKAVLTAETRMSHTRDALYEAHLDRMQRGVAESLRTSEIYLDMVRAHREIHGHLADIARVLRKADADD